MQYRAALSRISHAKNRKETPQDFYKRAVNQETETLAKVFEEYEKALHAANALDFDDLLLEAVRLLNHDEATREAWNRRLSYLMIDEYQDTNRPQYELMRLLSNNTATCAWWGTKTSRSIAGAGRHPQHSGFRARFPQGPHHTAGAELPVDEDHSGGGQRGGGEQQGAQG